MCFLFQDVFDSDSSSKSTNSLLKGVGSTPPHKKNMKQLFKSQNSSSESNTTVTEHTAIPVADFDFPPAISSLQKTNLLCKANVSNNTTCEFNITPNHTKNMHSKSVLNHSTPKLNNPSSVDFFTSTKPQNINNVNRVKVVLLEIKDGFSQKNKNIFFQCILKQI